jgi:hypothetical protein
MLLSAFHDSRSSPRFFAPQMTTLPPRKSNTFVGGNPLTISFGTKRRPGNNSGAYEVKSQPRVKHSLSSKTIP